MYQNIYDAVSGQRLDPALVAKARSDEMTFLVKDLHAYEYDMISRCKEETGRPPVPVTWVDVNKGDEDHPQLRAR